VFAQLKNIIVTLKHHRLAKVWNVIHIEETKWHIQGAPIIDRITTFGAT